MTYGFGKRYDIHGNEIDPDRRPTEPELFRTEAVGGLLICPHPLGKYVGIQGSKAGNARLHRDDLVTLAAYILDLYRRMGLPLPSDKRRPPYIEPPADPQYPNTGPTGLEWTEEPR